MTSFKRGLERKRSISGSRSTRLDRGSCSAAALWKQSIACFSSKDAFAVADDAGAGQFVVVGFSMSGRFAQYLRVRALNRILGQVLVAPCPASPIQLPEEARREWLSLAGDAERFKATNAQFLTQPVDPHVLDRFGKQAAKVTPAALEGTLTALAQASFADKVNPSQAPTLIVGGIHDGLFPPALLREWFASMPHSRLAFLDSNHEIPIEQPRELAALLEAFLAGVLALSGSDCT